MGEDIPAAVGTGRAPPEQAGGRGFQHLMLTYRGTAEYADALRRFVRGALDVGDQVLVAVPGSKARALDGVVGGGPSRVAFVDMAELGRNPARIIPFVREFLDRHAGRHVSYVGEPAWPGRTRAELREAARHEALVNRAFHDAAVSILCPYDAAGLPADVLADAERTHPLLAMREGSRASAAYLGPQLLPPACEKPLPPPPPDAQALVYRRSLAELRALVARCAGEAGLGGDRLADLVLAVSELAANTLQHTREGGMLRVWRTSREILCQIEDDGAITDALAGRIRPAGGEPGGHGLWLVNQVCDLVEVRSRPSGTTIRVRMRLGRR